VRITRTLTIVRHEVFVTIRRKGYLFMSFGVPIVATVIVLAYVLLQGGTGGEEPDSPLGALPDKPIGYVDYSGVFIEPDNLTGVIVRYKDEVSARAALERGQITSYYVIAADYLESGEVTRKAPQLDFMGSDTDLFRAFLIQELLGDESPDLLSRVYQPARIIEHQLDAAGVEVSQIDEEQRYGGNFILVYGFAMMLLLSTMIPAGYLLRSVVEEKENRTIEIVLASIRPIELMAGKVLGLGAMGLIQVSIWLISGWVLFHLAAGAVPTLQGVELTLTKMALLVAFFLGGFLLVASFQAGLGAVSTSMREGPQYATFFTLPMIIPLWFVNVFLEAPNGTLAVVLSLIPLTAPLSMVQRVAITAVPMWQVALSLALLAVAVAVTLWLAAKIFHVHTLLAGTVPKPVELLRLLLNSSQ
jgi:ABC-2 type transport system permease protein